MTSAGDPAGDEFRWSENPERPGGSVRSDAFVDPRRVLIVEDDSLLCSLLRESLTAHGFSVQSSSNAADARDSIDSFDPDVILLDIHLGDGPSGLDLGLALNAARPDIALVFLSRYADSDLLGYRQPLPPGAGYLRKDLIGQGSQLVEAIEAVLREEPGQARHRPPEGGSIPADLSPTQLAVLALAAKGLSNEEIARRRATTARAVEIQLRNAYAKLGLLDDDDVNPRVAAIRRYLTATGALQE